MAKRTTKSKSSPPQAPHAVAPPAREPVLVKNESVLAAERVLVEPMTMAAKPIVRASHEQIARRAFELFLSRGGRNGHPLEDWLAAEREILRVA